MSYLRCCRGRPAAILSPRKRLRRSRRQITHALTASSTPIRSDVVAQSASSSRSSRGVAQCGDLPVATVVAAFIHECGGFFEVLAGVFMLRKTQAGVFMVGIAEDGRTSLVVGSLTVSAITS